MSRLGAFCSLFIIAPMVLLGAGSTWEGLSGREMDVTFLLAGAGVLVVALWALSAALQVVLKPKALHRLIFNHPTETVTYLELSGGKETLKEVTGPKFDLGVAPFKDPNPHSDRRVYGVNIRLDNGRVYQISYHHAEAKAHQQVTEIKEFWDRKPASWEG